MMHINLLPWRESLRKEQQRQFISVAVGAVLLAGVVLLYIHMHVGGLLDNQTARNNLIKKETTLVEVKIAQIKDLESEKRKLLDRMKIIQALQVRQPEVVHLLDELVRTVPDGIYLTSVAQKDNALEIRGVAQSNARVSTLMRNLEASGWYSDPELEVIKVNTKGRVRTSDFTLRVLHESGVKEEAAL